MVERRGEFAGEYEKMCEWIIANDAKTMDDLIQIPEQRLCFTYPNGTVQSKWWAMVFWERKGGKVWTRITLCSRKAFQNTSRPERESFSVTIQNLSGTKIFVGRPSSISESVWYHYYLWKQVELTDGSFKAMELRRGGWSMSVTFEIKTVNVGPLVDQFYRMVTKLENDKENSDVKIISSDGQEFFAYRWILSEKSDVFAAMFKSNMKEKKSGVVKIDDLSGTTVKILLHFIYTREIGAEWSTPGTVEELVYAVDKYQIQELKNFLDVNVGKVCCLQNAGNLLGLAEKTGLKKAEADILAFIGEKCKNTAGYFELVKNTKIN